jgi:hypothetical protein
MSLAQVKYGRAVAACRPAQGFDLPATEKPFILRHTAWEFLAKLIDQSQLDRITKPFGPKETPGKSNPRSNGRGDALMCDHFS